MTQDNNANKRYPVRNIYQGNYTCKCYNCEQEFTDYKKSVLCGPCAVKLAANINKPTDNAGQVTAEEIKIEAEKIKNWLEENIKNKHGIPITIGDKKTATLIAGAMYEYASLVSEERCREKEVEIEELLTQRNDLVNSEIPTYIGKIKWLEQQLEIRDKQLEEWKQNEVKAIKTMLDQADRIKELKQQLGEVKAAMRLIIQATECCKDDLVISDLRNICNSALTAHQEQKQESTPTIPVNYDIVSCEKCGSKNINGGWMKMCNDCGHKNKSK